MADFNLLIRERLFTDSNPRGGDLNITIKDISYSDNRVLRIPSGSESTLFDLSNVVGAGQFVTSSLKYARVTNLNTTHSINLMLESASTEVANFDLKPQGSFLLSSAEFTGSIVVEDANYNKYAHITSVKAHPSVSIGNIEYFLVCN